MRRAFDLHKSKAAWAAAALLVAATVALVSTWRGGSVRVGETASPASWEQDGAADRKVGERRPRGRLSEAEKVERLLRMIERSEVTFIRNGTEYGGSEAAKHLRRKLKAAGVERVTLEKFIEEIGSRSSMTGKVYRVRLADGTVMDAGPWMRRQGGEDSGSAKDGSEPQDR